MSSPSIIEYFGGSNGNCGYCKQDKLYNSHGFWAHTLQVEDYQNLIDRNWRRSGQYCYVPTNKNTCCPMYTIKCDVNNFKMSRSHKKVIKKVHQFLRDGTKEKNRTKASEVHATISSEPVPSKTHTDLNVLELATLKNEGNSSQIEKPHQKSSNDEIPIQGSYQVDIAGKKQRPMKKKFIRLERKKAKLAVKGLTLADVPRRRHKSIEKTIENRLSEEPKDGKHKLQVKLVRSNEGSTPMILDLFQKYQMKIHNDSIEKNSQRSYERFLVNTPLQFRKDASSPPEGFGSFHHQYYLDGELIAVGVIDILPSCVSSVYFYYNPDYSFLSLGTYASLREIALVRELSKSCPLLKYYYLGFYIPTCPKMRYKSNVKPSYLLCPEVFTWHLLDETLSSEIDANHYLRINKTENDRNAVTKDDLGNLLVLSDRTKTKYKDYRKILKSQKKSTDDIEEVFEYATKVGKNLSQNMLLFRC